MLERGVEIVTSAAGTARLVSGGIAQVSEVPLSPLRLASGRLAVCDPLAPSSIVRLPLAVVPGDYDVNLTLATSSEGLVHVAFASLRVPVERLILPVGVEPVSRELNSPYPVDTGLGCFLDDGLRDAWLAQAYENRCDLDDTLRKVKNWQWGTGLRDGAASHLVAFSSGEGDGLFDTLLLLADDHWILATDFQVVDVRDGDSGLHGLSR